MEEIRRYPGGTIDCEFYALRAREHRSAYVRRTLSPSQLGPLSPKAKRRLATFGAALALATGAFWATMLAAPPISEAGSSALISIYDLHRSAPLDLRTVVADAH